MNKIELDQELKKNQFEAYQKANVADQQATDFVTQIGTSKIRWNIVKDKGQTDFVPTFKADHVIVSSVKRLDEKLERLQPKTAPGYKIDLTAKLEELKTIYTKNYIKARSHNFIVAKFAEVKVAFIGYMLGQLGVTFPDLQQLQKKALNSSISENLLMFEENEYNGEMINIIGGSHRKIKSDLNVIDEIRSQLSTQLTRLGKSEYSDPEKVTEMRISACQRIIEEFKQELNFLEYQLEYSQL